MGKTLLISVNATRECGQFLGDQICALKVAWLFAQNPEGGEPYSKILLAMSPGNELHFLWQKFIDTYAAEVVYDTFHPGNCNQRWEAWTQWRTERNIEGRKFHVYRELYRRIDGAARQNLLCGGENGLRRKNIFEYLYYGQENYKYFSPEDSVLNIDHFGDDLIHHQVYPANRGVLIAPHAKCQGNHVFTFDFWTRVVRKLVECGIPTTVNYNGHFAEELNGHPLYRKIFPDFKGLQDELCQHRLVSCGNTGVGWHAFACGIPVLAMQPPNSNMPDYRYELCGCRSLVEIVDTPDSDYVARRIVEEVNRVTVFTTGCYDVLHAGHIRHLQESRALGSKLIVAMNSDASVKLLKGPERPINNQDQRACDLSAIRYVDEVRIFDGMNALGLIKELRPDVITNGCDHVAAEVVGKEEVEAYGGRVVITGGTRDQSSTKIIAKIIKPHDILKAVQDAAGVSVNPLSKLNLLAKEYLSVAGLPGDVADVGAYRGGCSLILRRLDPNKELHVFDTWCGTPIDDDLCHHKKGEWPASLKECQALVGTGERTHYHEGVFPYSAEGLQDRMFCFVFVDPDVYPTVRDAIDFFWPRLVTGGKMMWDDYGWQACEGVKKAVDEKFPEADRIVYGDRYACVVVKK